MYVKNLLLGLGLIGIYQVCHAQSELETCLDSVGIQTSFADQNSTFITDTESWQGRVRPVPSGVAYPRSESDVVASLKCATEAGVKVSALNGGHSFLSYGQGGNDGALVLNLTAFNSLSYDEATGHFTVGGGSHVAPAAKYLWENHAAHFPHVRGAWVGITGSAIGGGLGTTSRFLGTTLDNLVAVTIALANGTVVTASETENTELFFAVRGAGSSYGIILTLTLKTWKPIHQNVTAWAIDLPDNTTLDTGVKALLAVQDYGLAESTPDELYIRWTLSVPTWGGVGYYYGAPEDFESVIAPLIDALPAGANLTSRVLDFWAAETDATGSLDITYETSPSRSFYVHAKTLTKSHPLTYENAAALFNYTSLAFNRTDLTQYGFLDLWASRSNAYIKDNDTAYAHGDNLWIVRWEGDLAGDDSPRGQPSLYTQDFVDYIKAGLDPFVKQLKAEGATIRGYANYRDSELSSEEWSEQLYPGENFQRLKTLKAELDPEELFNANSQSIPAS